jgi:hypothetical protein
MLLVQLSECFGVYAFQFWRLKLYMAESDYGLKQNYFIFILSSVCPSKISAAKFKQDLANKSSRWQRPLSLMTRIYCRQNLKCLN